MWGGITSSSGAVLSRYDNKGKTGQTSVEVETCREEDRYGAYITFSDATQRNIRSNCRELLVFFDEIIKLMKEYFLEFEDKGHKIEDLDKEVDKKYDNACYSAAQNNNDYLSKWVELMEKNPQFKANKKLVEAAKKLQDRNIDMCEAMKDIIGKLIIVYANIKRVQKDPGDIRLI